MNDEEIEMVMANMIEEIGESDGLHLITNEAVDEFHSSVQDEINEQLEGKIIVNEDRYNDLVEHSCSCSSEKKSDYSAMRGASHTISNSSNGDMPSLTAKNNLEEDD